MTEYLKNSNGESRVAFSATGFCAVRKTFLNFLIYRSTFHTKRTRPGQISSMCCLCLSASHYENAVWFCRFGRIVSATSCPPISVWSYRKFRCVTGKIDLHCIFFDWTAADNSIGNHLCNSLRHFLKSLPVAFKGTRKVFAVSLNCNIQNANQSLSRFFLLKLLSLRYKKIIRLIDFLLSHEQTPRNKSYNI